MVDPHANPVFIGMVHLIHSPPQTVGMSRMYHPECFVCSKCGTPLGEKDPYTLLSSGELLW